MKKLIICFLVFLMIFAVGCAPGQNEDAVTTEEVTEAPEVEIRVDISKDYVLIFAGDDASYDTAYRFSRLYSEATGVTLKMTKDKMVAKSESAREIVIGKTDREEYYQVDYDSLVSDAFVLALRGERLYICAGSEAGYEAAFAAFFKESLGIEDIDMIEKVDKIPSLPEGFELISEPSVKLEAHITARRMLITTRQTTSLRLSLISSKLSRRLSIHTISQPEASRRSERSLRN